MQQQLKLRAGQTLTDSFGNTYTDPRLVISQAYYRYDIKLDAQHAVIEGAIYRDAKAVDTYDPILRFPKKLEGAAMTAFMSEVVNWETMELSDTGISMLLQLEDPDPSHPDRHIGDRWEVVTND